MLQANSATFAPVQESCRYCRLANCKYSKIARTSILNQQNLRTFQVGSPQLERVSFRQIFDSALNLLGRRSFDAVFRPLVYDLFIAGEKKVGAMYYKGIIYCRQRHLKTTRVDNNQSQLISMSLHLVLNNSESICKDERLT